MKTSIKTLIFISIFILSSCTTTATPTAEPEEITLKLSWHDGVQFLGYYIAQEQGFYAEEGLDISIEPLFEASEFITAPQRILDKEFDFSISSSEVIMDIQAQGLPLTVISSILQVNPRTLFVQADSGIITPADFAGRTVAIKGPVWEVLLAQILATVDLSIDDVIMIRSRF